MTEYFTQNDLMKYIYQEMTDLESENFVEALQLNPMLMQEYIGMLSTLEQLDHLIFEPSDRVVNAIKRKAHPTGLERV